MQKVDLYQPMIASRIGPAPLMLRVAVTPNNGMVAGGVPISTTKIESYVLLSALPQELQERVKTAIQMLVSGI